MKYLHCKFINYIGIYNGMGLTEISIDFTKCIHNIVLITGRNGSGKSTIMNHLNPFPDSSTSFISEKTAEKHLVLSHEGDTYTIQLISPADIKGRKTTKAYIQKNGIELNENGNVSSYKDIIFSEFELDSNYLSLSNLSSTDRGMGDKTPAERKRFVSGIIDNLEIYNNMYKTLNKKSLVYKSHINTIHTKIMNIGSKDILEEKLRNLQTKEADLNNKIMNANNQIVAIQAKNSIDEDEANKIQKLNDTHNELKSKLDSLMIELDKFFHRTKINKEYITDRLSSDEKLVQTYNSKLSELRSSIKEKSDRLSNVSNNIISLEAELSKSSAGNENISERYNESNNTIKSLENDLSKLGIPDNNDYIIIIANLITFCDKFCNIVDVLNDGLSESDLRFLVYEYDNNFIPNNMKILDSISNDITRVNLQMSELQGKIKLLAVLENRPKNCKIDSCPFISDSVKLKKSINTDLIDELSKLQEELLMYSDKASQIQEVIDHANSLHDKKMKLDSIKALVSENEMIKMFYPKFFSNYLEMICNLNSFNEIRERRKLVDGLIILKSLDMERQNNKILEVEYNSFKEKIQLINSSKAMISKLKDEEISLTTEITKLKSEYDNYNTMVAEINNKIEVEYAYNKTYTEYLEICKDFEVVNDKIGDYNTKASKAMESLGLINNLKDNIKLLSGELDPVMREISTISGQLTLLDSYYSEYDEYNHSYRIIETLKKYCSPTGGGIQTLFMQLYMSKTKELANEVLAMLFNGSYQLLDFIINENEFRIPFIGEGLPVDDISSGSSAQISMMSMIINLVLLHQGSSKFNIARLDEVNAALDAYNNSLFVPIIQHCMNILNIEQLFMISHSTETDISFADIIKLKGYDNYESFANGSNIIWDYNKDANT